MKSYSKEASFRKNPPASIRLNRIGLPLLVFVVLSILLTACDGGSNVPLIPGNTDGNLISLPTTPTSGPVSFSPGADLTGATPTPSPATTPTSNPATTNAPTSNSATAGIPTASPIVANTPTPQVVSQPPTASPAATKPGETNATATAQPAMEAPASGAPEDYKPIIWFSASTLKPGDTLTVSGNGYPPNTELNVALGLNSAAPLGSYAKPKTDDKGRFSAQLKLDKDISGSPLTPGRLVVAVSTPDQKIAAGAPVTLVDATKPTATPLANKTTVAQGQSRSGKWIDVSLSKQKLTAYDGDKVIYTSLISSGVARYPTVTGTFSVYLKYEKQTMVGGRGSDAYNLPNVPYVMYFYQDYGIHGTYWHSNFGRPMSHGCVNTPTDVARLLYNWAPIGTPVVVHN